MRSQILSFLAVHPVAVELPVGQTLHVRKWTAAERQTFQREHKANPARLYERLFVGSVCDPVSGELLFTSADLDEVGRLDGVALELVAAKVLELNGLAEGDDADPSKASRS